MNRFLSTVLALAALLGTNWVLFNDPLAPLNFLLVMSDRLAAPFWQVGALLGVVVASLVFLPPLNNYIRPPFRLAAFLSSSLVLAVVFVGLYADSLRRSLIREFAADAVVQHSFFRSIREVPREFQYYLHAAALKNCVPHAWSYRKMEFYILPPNVAANVLPYDWLKRCSIKRTS